MDKPRSLPLTSSASATSMATVHDVSTDGAQLYVADVGNSGVMVWNSIPSSNNAPATGVLAAPSLTTNAPAATYSASADPGLIVGVFYDQDKLLATSYNGYRTLIFQSH